MRLGRPTPCICASLDGDRVIHEGVNLTLAGARANLSPRCPEHPAAIFPLAAQRQIHPTHLYSPLIQAALAGWEAGALPKFRYDDAVG